MQRVQAVGARGQGRWRTLGCLVLVCTLCIGGSLPLHDAVMGRTPGQSHAAAATAPSRRQLGQLQQVEMHSTTQKQQPQQPQQDVDLASSPAGLHGLVQKEGPLDTRNWHLNYTMDRMRAFNWWLRDRRALPVRLEGTNAKPTLPPVFPSCHIFVNHRYRFIYLRHAKTASTTLLNFFGLCSDGSDSRNSTCMERLDFGPTQGMPADELAAMWASYFAFSFVRNPFNRAVSSYLMMMRSLEWVPEPAGAVGQQGKQQPAEQQPQQQEGVDSAEDDAGEQGEEEQEDGSEDSRQQQEQPGDEEQPGQQKQRYMYRDSWARGYSWSDFCADPSSFIRICPRDRKCHKRDGSGKHTAAHVQAQLPCLTAAGGGWAVDYLGRVENIDQDLNEVLAILDQRRGEGMPPLGRLKKRLSNVNGQRCKRIVEDPAYLMFANAPEYYCDRMQYFQGQHEPCVRLLADYYRGDVERMQFPTTSSSASASSS